MRSLSIGAVAAGVAAAVDAAADDLVDLAQLMVETPSPPGEEQELALELAEWGSTSCSEASWRVDPFAPMRANVLASFAVETARTREVSTSTSTLGLASTRPGGRHLCLYGHLDTSLMGEAERDGWITGDGTPPPAFRHDHGEGTIAGFGLAVAKGPAAAATIAFRAVVTGLQQAIEVADAGEAAEAAAGSGPSGSTIPPGSQISLLLAAGGTHRAPFGFGAGVRHALDGGLHPTAVVNTKAGPAGLLYEEPGALYLRVRLQARWGSVMFRSGLAPGDGGLPVALPMVIAAIEGWRAQFRSRPVAPTGLIAREAGIGAIRAGAADKPDLVPGFAQLGLYVITGAGDEPEQISAELRDHIDAASPGLEVEVEPYGFTPAARTDPGALVVTSAQEAWRHRFGADPPLISGWTGSTDGGIFRTAGIDTVRVGATPLPPAADDARLERFAVADLVAMAHLYADLAVRYLFADEEQS